MKWYYIDSFIRPNENVPCVINTNDGRYEIGYYHEDVGSFFINGNEYQNEWILRFALINEIQ